MWAWALTKLPWKTIIVHAPTIVDAARKLYVKTQTPTAASQAASRSSDGIAPFRRAIEELEAREAQHAALFAELARQVQDMTTAVERLRAGLLVALWGAGFAIVLTIATIVVLLWRG